MRYMANSRMADGASLERLVRYFDENAFSPTAWDLVRRRTVDEYVMKEGEIPGVVVFLEAGSADEAAAVLDDLPVVKLGLLTFDLDPLGKTMRLQAGG